MICKGDSMNSILGPEIPNKSRLIIRMEWLCGNCDFS